MSQYVNLLVYDVFSPPQGLVLCPLLRAECMDGRIKYQECVGIREKGLEFRLRELFGLSFGKT